MRTSMLVFLFVAFTSGISQGQSPGAPTGALKADAQCQGAYSTTIRKLHVTSADSR